MKHPADPSPRSPYSVLHDRAYRFVAIYGAGIARRLVVWHCGTETHWMTYCLDRDDAQAAIWFEVRPVTRTVVEYERVT